MKVLIVTTVESTINSFLKPHINLLYKNGVNVDVMTKENRQQNSEYKDIINNFYNIKFSRNIFKNNIFNLIKKIRRIVIKNKYNYIHTHTPIASFIVRLACRDIKSVKIIYTAHGFHFHKNSSFFSWILFYPMEKIAARWTDYLIIMNNEDYEISKKFKLRNDGKVYKVNGVGQTFQVLGDRNLKIVNKEEITIFYAAELNNNKNQELLIDVVKLLVDEGYNIKLLLAGSGPNKEKYQYLISRNNLQKNIFLLGFREDILNLIDKSDIIVASSKREGLPVNIMEGMSRGKPIIATNIRGHNDLIKDGENGFLCNFNSHDFKEKIIKLIEDRDLYHKISKNNLEDVKKFGINNVLESMEILYKDMGVI